MSATSMAGRVMDAADDDGSGGFRQQETALALRAGWRPAADGAGRDGDTWPWSPDLHVPGAAEWCAGRCRLREDAWPIHSQLLADATALLAGDDDLLYLSCFTCRCGHVDTGSIGPRPDEPKPNRNARQRSPHQVGSTTVDSNIEPLV